MVVIERQQMLRSGVAGDGWLTLKNQLSASAVTEAMGFSRVRWNGIDG
jgi:hypothetical protein